MMIGVARRHTSTENGVNPKEGTWMLHIDEGEVRNCFVNGHHKAIKPPRKVNETSKITVRLDTKKMQVYFYLEYTRISKAPLGKDDDLRELICKAPLGKDDDPRELVAAVDLYCPGQKVGFTKLK